MLNAVHFWSDISDSIKRYGIFIYALSPPIYHRGCNFCATAVVMKTFHLCKHIYWLLWCWPSQLVRILLLTACIRLKHKGLNYRVPFPLSAASTQGYGCFTNGWWQITAALCLPISQTEWFPLSSIALKVFLSWEYATEKIMVVCLTEEKFQLNFVWEF